MKKGECKMPKNFIATPSRTRQILTKHKLSLKKSLGQNFIIDTNILKRIIEASSIDKTSGVIEIGPGIGSLTEQLALHAQHVVAFEIDERLKPVLQSTLNKYQNINIIYKDILKADVAQVIRSCFSKDQDIHIVANLPYYITTPILLNLLQTNLPLKSITVMIQKEVAARMSAHPGTKAYGSLSVVVQYYTEARVVMDVPKTVFIPQPNVTSSVLHLTLRRTPPVQVHDEETFFSIVRASFQQRRKTLRNNLKAYFGKKYTSEQLNQIFEESQIDGSRRGESLSLAEFARLTNAIIKK